jgi:hypothetical protein
MSDFTPGPWMILFDDISDEIVIQAHGGEYVASIDCDGAYDGKIANCIDANARLIAAAPDLLGALEALLRFAENTESELGIVLGSANSARAAIAKARGNP